MILIFTIASQMSLSIQAIRLIFKMCELQKIKHVVSIEKHNECFEKREEKIFYLCAKSAVDRNFSKAADEADTNCLFFH
jgi:hypothetical protein